MARYVQPNFIVDSSAAFLRNATFNSSTYLNGVSFISSPATAGVALPYALVVDTIGANVQIKSKLLGSMAFETSTNYYGKTQIDGFITIINASFGRIDTSIAALNMWDIAQDASIVALRNTNTAQEASIGIINASISAINLYQLVQDASILAAGTAVQGWNGLTRLNSSIGLGGTLTQAVTITTTNASTLTLAGLTSGTGLLAVIAPSGVLRTQQLGTAALEASTAFASVGALGNYLPLAGGTLTGLVTFAAAGWTLDSQNILALDTSAEGLGQLDTHLPTSAAVKSAINTAINVTLTATNGLTKTVNDIHLGGSLTEPTTITTDITNTLIFAGLQTSAANTPLALVQDTTGTAIKVRALGTMAWETATNYVTWTLYNSSVGNINSSINSVWTYINNVVNASFGSYVKKSGDTMTGALVINAGGLSVTNNVSVGGSLAVTNGAYIGGDLTIDGSLYVRSTESIDVSSAFIVLNTGQTGTPPASMQSGIIIDRGTLEPYVLIYDETLKTFRVGVAKVGAGPSFVDASTQAVATREDAPLSFGIPFWNATTFRFETSTGFDFTPNVGLHLTKATASTETTALVWNSGTGLVTSRVLGDHAFDTSVYTLRTQFDSSMAVVYPSIADLSTNKLDAVATVTLPAGGHQVYSTEISNVAYIKKIFAGAGASIISDSSSITISVSGAAGYVSKYRSTFDGTAGTSFAIPAGVHTLGTGPFTVTVYEFNEQIYTGIYVGATGDVSITWGAGSITDTSCKFIITG